MLRDFPLGKAALALLLVAVTSGVYLAFHPIIKTNATLTFWVFAKEHYESYKPIVRAFEKTHPGVKVDLQLAGERAVATRLRTAFLSGLDVPDLVEVEISQSGSFFRGPEKDFGFEDLTDRVHSSGLINRIVKSRLAAYTHRGRIYGLPHDVHPVMIAYRRDIFESQGVDVREIRTWDDFVRIGHRLTIPNKRYMIELYDSNAETFEILLYQRGGGYFDKKGRCIIDNQAAIDTMCWYVPLVAGKNRIAGNLGTGQIRTQAVEEGYLLCLLCPDWRGKVIENDIPRVAGKMAMMPMPMPDGGGYRTSTYGGTMLGMARRCANKDLAWELALELYTGKKALAGRWLETNTIPPVRDAWEHPAFKQRSPYWSNQPVGEMYAELAPHAPPQYTSCFITAAKVKSSEALVACVQYYRKHGDKGFEDYVRARMSIVADQIRNFESRNPYK